MQITILRNGQQHGPYTVEQVQTYLQRGDLVVGDLAWTEGLNEWLPLSIVLGANMPPQVAVVPPPWGAPASSSVVEVSPYAGFWYRFLALLIDTVLSTIVAVIIAVPFGIVLGLAMASSSSMETISTAGELMGNAIGVIVSWLYFTVAESSGWQATPGKKMLGLKVTDVSGERIGFGRANGRYWGKILSALILCIGYMMAGWTERKQALHDMMAGTLVVKTAP
jgi:uncharacterized RDD family membrane protein YckC